METAGWRQPWRFLRKDSATRIGVSMRKPLHCAGAIASVAEWGGWPRDYDYAIELSFGAKPALPS
jgi:hypothetical protein